MVRVAGAAVLTAILTGVSNATSEGLNRVIKLEGRKAYGFRNPTIQRRRQVAAGSAGVVWGGAV